MGHIARLRRHDADYVKSPGHTMGTISTNPFYAPPPTQILSTVFSLFAEGTIFSHLEATFTAAVVGLVIGLVLGIVCGFAAALIPFLADVLEPIMMLLNAIPRVILAPLFVIWLGIELPSKIALAVILVAVLIVFAVYSGIRMLISFSLTACVHSAAAA